MKRMEYSALGGIGMLLAIGGLFASVIGAGANRPPAYLLPLGLILLISGGALAVFGIANARRMQRDRELARGPVERSELLTPPYLRKTQRHTLILWKHSRLSLCRLLNMSGRSLIRA